MTIGIISVKRNKQVHVDGTLLEKPSGAYWSDGVEHTLTIYDPHTKRFIGEAATFVGREQGRFGLVNDQ